MNSKLIALSILISFSASAVTVEDNAYLGDGYERQDYLKTLVFAIKYNGFPCDSLSSAYTKINMIKPNNDIVLVSFNHQKYDYKLDWSKERVMPLVTQTIHPNK